MNIENLFSKRSSSLQLGFWLLSHRIFNTLIKMFFLQEYLVTFFSTKRVCGAGQSHHYRGITGDSLN